MDLLADPLKLSRVTATCYRFKSLENLHLTHYSLLLSTTYPNPAMTTVCTFTTNGYYPPVSLDPMLFTMFDAVETTKKIQPSNINVEITPIAQPNPRIKSITQPLNHPTSLEIDVNEQGLC